MNPSSPDVVIALAALALAVASSLITWAITSRRWRRLLRSAHGRSLESLLLDQQRQLAEVASELARAREAQTAITQRLTHCLQAPGVVRFNAFAETGSDLSFAVALLDAEGCGVVVSSLYGREESRAYAKPVRGGESRFRLTDEEKEAISQVWRP